MNKEELYNKIINMELHQQIPIPNEMGEHLLITRIIGGWIYEVLINEFKIQPIFVPFVKSDSKESYLLGTKVYKDSNGIPDDLISMELHDEIPVPGDINGAELFTVIRIISGWIYVRIHSQGSENVCYPLFVPYSKEFTTRRSAKSSTRS